MFELSWKEIATVGMVLFAVIDILDSIPIIIDYVLNRTYPV